MLFQSSFSFDSIDVDDPFASDSEPGIDPALGASLGDLFSAFDHGDAVAPATNPPVEETEEVVGTDLGDLFGAFESAETLSEPSSEKEKDEPKGLMDAIAPYMGEENDEEMRRIASLQLIGLGNTNALAYIVSMLDGLTVQQKREVADHLEDQFRPEVLDVLTRLLRDSSDSVRKSAVSSLLKGLSRKDWTDALFTELTRKGSKLSPFEVYGYRMRVNDDSAKRHVRAWVLQLLEEPEVSLVNKRFALILLEQVWRRGDEKRIESYFLSEDPWSRRAAWYVLGKKMKKKLAARVSEPAGDASEYVRLTIPAIFSPARSQWLHYFDEKHYRSNSSYSYGSTSRKKLSSSVADILQDLSNDPSKKVRLESMMVLLESRKSVDLTELVSLVNQLSDPKILRRRIGEFLEKNYKRLDLDYAVLLPFLDDASVDNDETKRIQNHFRLEGKAMNWRGSRPGL